MANSVSRQLIKEEVLRRGWVWHTFGEGAFFCSITNDEGRTEILRGTQPSQTSANGFLIAKYKHVTMAFLEQHGYTPPPYLLVENETQAFDFIQEHGVVVVKPVDSLQTKGVSVGVNSLDGLKQAIQEAKKYSDTVMLQKHLQGSLYRLVVLNGKFIAAIQRRAAEVVGDGSNTVQELIEIANQDPRRGSDSGKILKKISLKLAEDFLGEGLLAVPERGEVVKVCAIDSVSVGGEAINVTDVAHESWRSAMVEIADKAGLFICGYDVICDDISKPIPTVIPMLEFNSMPGLKLLHYPTAGGEPIDAASMLLDAVFSTK